MKRLRSFRPMILTVLALTASTSGICQSKVSSNKSKNNQLLHEKLDLAIERSGQKMAEAKELVHNKRYSAAEAACKSGIEICSSAPFLQVPIQKLLAFVYLSEGLYNDTLRIMEPLYHAEDCSYEYTAWMGIAYAQKGRLKDGSRVLRNYIAHGTDLYFAPALEDYPLGKSDSKEAIEATALVIWGWLNPEPKHPEDAMARLQRAADLAPKNAAVNFALAQRLDIQQHDWKSAEPHYIVAYTNGNAEIRRVSLGRLQRHDIKLDGRVQNPSTGG